MSNKMIDYFKTRVESDTTMDSTTKDVMHGLIASIEKQGIALYDAVAARVGPKFALVMLEAALQHGMTKIDVTSDEFVNGDSGIPSFRTVRAG